MIRIASNRQELAVAAADFFVDRAEAAVAERGRFMVALSGGSTPRSLHELLSIEPFVGGIDWGLCHVFWGDERMVPADHPDSNFGMAKASLLSRVPIPAPQVHRVPTEIGDAPSAADAYEATIRQSLGIATGEWPRFDLILLGMGSDGHCASLFPGSPSLEVDERLVVASPPGVLPPPVDRVTMTLPLINAARAVAFLVAGADKADALRRVRDGDRSLPAARVAPVPGTVWWFLDQEATGEGRTTR